MAETPPPPSPAPRVTVAVCTYDRYPCLDDCIAGLAAQDFPPDAVEWIIVDNSPNAARSAAESKRHAGHAPLRWLHEKTAGLSHARNVAMREARAPIIAYLDDDAIPEPDWLTRLMEAYAELGEGFAGVGGRIIPIFAAPRPDWLSDKLLNWLSVVDLGEETRGLQPKEWVAGANISYRVAALRRVGGFSRALGRVGPGISLMSNDETELAERLAAQGGRMGYAGRAVVRHLVEESRLNQEWFRRRVAWQAVSDFVRHPQKLHADREAAWGRLKGYLAQQPPHLRTQRALAVEQAAQPAMEAQLAAIYNAVHSLLGAVGETDE